MNDHLTNEKTVFAEHPQGLFEPYLDGELDPEQIQRIESHLSACADCRRIVDERQRVTSMLGEWQPALPRFSEEVFIEHLAISLTKHAQKKSGDILPAARLMWQLLPVILLFGLVFIATVQITSSIFGLIPGVEQLVVSKPNVISEWIDLPGMTKEVFRFALDFSLMRWTWLNSIIAIFALGLAYLGWLSTWWVSNHQEIPSILTIEKE